MHLRLAALVALVLLPNLGTAQEPTPGTRCFALSDQPIFALFDDGTRAEVPFGYVLTVEEVVPNYLAARFQGRYALFDPDQLRSRHSAREFLVQRIESAPRAEDLAIKARIEHDLRNLESAIADANEALKWDPQCAMALVFRGSSYYIQKEYELAEQDIDLALELQPENDLAHNVKFLILQQTDRKPAALKHVERAIQINPHRALYYSNCGSILLQLERTEDAVANIKKAIEVEPAYYSGHYFMGYHLNRQGKQQEARKHFLRSAELNPRHYWTNYYLYSLAKQNRQAKEAIRFLERAVKSREAPESIKNTYAWLLATSYDDAVRNGTRAVEVASQLVQSSREPDHRKMQYLKTLAAAYAELGQFNKAIEVLDEIDSSRYHDAMVGEMYESFEQQEPFRIFPR